MALTDKLTAIANAIRAKTGGSDLLTLDEMPQEIQSIQTGGGGDTALADSILSGTVTSYSSNTLSKVGTYGFGFKTAITSVDCPNVTSIGDSAFYSCSALTNVNLDWESITSLSGNTFYGCSALSTPIEFSGVETISGGSSFANSGFVELRFPKLTSAIAYNALYGGYLGKLEKVYVGGTCTFGSMTFNNQTHLNTVILASNEICTAQSSNLFTSTPIASGTGYIYVPQALIEQYKVATNWATFANQFRAIEDYPEICGEVS